jgi:hypothetical protein
MIPLPDLTDEEWEALHRVKRGPPEALLVPATIRTRLIGLGLIVERAGAVRVSDAGKRLILRYGDDAPPVPR